MALFRKNPPPVPRKLRIQRNQPSLHASAPLPHRALRHGRLTGPPAHLGTALGSTEHPDLSAENRAKWQFLSDKDVNAFVFEAMPLLPHSTLVMSAQYHLGRQELEIVFQDTAGGGGGYYGNVWENEAIDFMLAPSKGAWIINVCIGRHNLLGHAHWLRNGGASIKPWTPY